MSDILQRLERVIASRKAALARDPSLADQSYVARLLSRTPLKRAQKMGEEAVEAVIAAAAEDDAALASESADLLFHLLVVLAGRGVAFDRVLAVLEQREGVSGIAEKAARKKAT